MKTSNLIIPKCLERLDRDQLSQLVSSFKWTELNPKHHGNTTSFPLTFLGHLYHLFIPFPPVTDIITLS